MFLSLVNKNLILGLLIIVLIVIHNLLSLIVINNRHILIFNFIEMNSQKKLSGKQAMRSKVLNLNNKRKLKTQNPEIFLTHQQQIAPPNNHPNSTIQLIQFKTQKKVYTQPNDTSIHDANCVCKDCDCGRHLCKLSFSCKKPRPKMVTIYRKTFKKPSVIHQNKAIHPQQSERSVSKSISITSNTIYGKYFNKFNQNIEKTTHNHNMLQQTSNKPDDSPFMRLTTYNQNFIGHKMSNQYVPYHQGTVPNFLSLKHTTSYQSNFCNPQHNKTKINNYKNCRPVSCQQNNRQKQLTQAIMRSTFKSTYQQNFEKVKTQGQENNTQQMVSKLIIPKRSYDDFAIVSSQKVKNKNNLTSSYMKDFRIQQNIICPARAKILRMNKSNLLAIKQSLQENSNFKQLLQSLQPV